MNCVNCGCKVYNGHCVNCHEETYIAEQSWQNDELTSFSQEFRDKLKVQAKEAEEFSGGTILPECPDCGQYCKIPHCYHINGLGQDAHAHSYCQRCKKKVELEVSFC